jgi:hypothetical protein
MKQLVLVSPEIDKHKVGVLSIVCADKPDFVIVSGLVCQHLDRNAFRRI